jgi:tetratricopeptide (TPR) repeat protein
MRASLRSTSPSARQAIACAALLACACAQAAPYEALLRDRNFQEVERQANAALAAAPRDPQAMAAKIDAILALGLEQRIEEAVALGEACVAAHPRDAGCQEGLGNALGAKAVNAGIFSAMGYAGKIRDAFRKAVELDPARLSARFSLLQYYLVAPGIVGGGADKARSLAQDTAKTSLEAAQLMQARLAIDDKDLAKAERLARAVEAPADSKLGDERRDTLNNIGFRYTTDKRHADGERVFRELQAAYPRHEAGVYGLGRVRQEQGRQAEAVPFFEQAAALYPGAAVYYRLGQSLQATGARPKAAAAFEKALAARPALSKKQREDAQDQLKSMKE